MCFTGAAFAAAPDTPWPCCTRASQALLQTGQCSSEMSRNKPNDDGEGSGSRAKTRKKLSKVWDHFDYQSGSDTVTCKICKTTLAYHSSTSCMLQNLHRRHPGTAAEQR